MDELAGSVCREDSRRIVVGDIEADVVLFRGKRYVLLGELLVDLIGDFVVPVGDFLLDLARSVYEVSAGVASVGWELQRGVLLNVSAIRVDLPEDTVRIRDIHGSINRGFPLTVHRSSRPLGWRLDLVAVGVQFSVRTHCGEHANVAASISESWVHSLLQLRAIVPMRMPNETTGPIVGERSALRVDDHHPIVRHHRV